MLLFQVEATVLPRLKLVPRPKCGTRWNKRRRANVELEIFQKASMLRDHLVKKTGSLSSSGTFKNIWLPLCSDFLFVHYVTPSRVRVRSAKSENEAQRGACCAVYHLARKDSARICTNCIYLIEMRINIPFLSQEYTLEKSVLFSGTLLPSRIVTDAVPEWKLIRS